MSTIFSPLERLPCFHNGDPLHKYNRIDCEQTCLRNPAPNARVTLRRPFTLSLTMQWLSSGCSLLILITSCNSSREERKCLETIKDRREKIINSCSSSKKRDEEETKGKGEHLDRRHFHHGNMHLICFKCKNLV